jgi:hypothetical protein
MGFGDFEKFIENCDTSYTVALTKEFQEYFRKGNVLYIERFFPEIAFCENLKMALLTKEFCSLEVVVLVLKKSRILS